MYATVRLMCATATSHSLSTTIWLTVLPHSADQIRAANATN